MMRGEDDPALAKTHKARHRLAGDVVRPQAVDDDDQQATILAVLRGACRKTCETRDNDREPSPHKSAALHAQHCTRDTVIAITGPAKAGHYGRLVLLQRRHRIEAL